MSHLRPRWRNAFSTHQMKFLALSQQAGNGNGGWVELKMENQTNLSNSSLTRI